MIGDVSDSSTSLECPLADLACVHSWAGTQLFMRSLRVADYTRELYDEEIPFMAGAALLRQKSFSSGRHVARMAIRDAGFADAALPRADDGSVHWPQGLSGSVTHTDEWAVAAIAVQKECEADCIGIDLERIKPLEPGVKKLIATRTELEELFDSDVPDWQAIALFSMKESIYKCLARDFGHFIEFQDVELTGLGDERPAARFRRTELSRKYPISRLELRMAVSATQVLTLAWLRS